VFVFTTLSIPFLFFSFLLIRAEYEEHFVYGEIHTVKIININVNSGTSDDIGFNYTYDLDLLNSKKEKYTAPMRLSNSLWNSDKTILFTSRVKRGDSVQVKIISSHQARILKWKKIELNKYISYWGKLGKYILILILLSIAFFCYFKIYKKMKK